MSTIKLNHNKILELEFLHDNPYDIDVIKQGNYCYNTITREGIKVNKDITNPENTMKEYIFNNIHYNKLKIVNTLYESNITDDDKLTFKDNIILVFDNMQLKTDNINMCKSLFKDKNIKIFIPFIYFAEQFINKGSDTLKSKIIKYKTKYETICDGIIVDNYFIDDNLTENYKLEADNIGFLYNNVEDKLINYNIFSDKNKIFTKDKKINEMIKTDLNYQLNIFYEYLNKIVINRKKKYFRELINLKQRFERYFIEDDEIKENIIFNIDIKQLFNDVRTFIMSLKEARDTYYLIEIQNMMKKSEYMNAQFFYITTDEISNCRCILEKISSINILGEIPRYIISIKDNKIALKLFNIYYKLSKTISKDSDMYKKNEEIKDTNVETVLMNTKNLITKIYTGGLYKKGNILTPEKIDMLTLNLDRYNILKMSDINNYDISLKFIKDRKYMEILNYIHNMSNKFYDLNATFSEDEYKNIEEIAKQNPKYLETIKKFNELFNELKYLYETIPVTELINNLKKLDKRNIWNDIIDDRELTDAEIEEYDEINKIPDIRNFTRLIGSIYTYNYKRFQEITKKTIEVDKWKGLYCMVFLDSLIHYHHKEEDLQFYKYIFPELFKEYPVDDFITMFHIELEYNLRLHKCDDN